MAAILEFDLQVTLKLNKNRLNEFVVIDLVENVISRNKIRFLLQKLENIHIQS